MITEVQSNQIMNFSRWTILLYCLISENIDSKTSKQCLPYKEVKHVVAPRQDKQAFLSFSSKFHFSYLVFRFLFQRFLWILRSFSQFPCILALFPEFFPTETICWSSLPILILIHHLLVTSLIIGQINLKGERSKYDLVLVPFWLR